MTKQFLVIDLNDAFNYYNAYDLDLLINEMYESELENGESFEQVNEWFYENHKVFEINGEIKEIN